MLSEGATTLLAILPRGEAASIRRSRLADILTMRGIPTTDREISTLTDELIQAGYPVASSRKGRGGVFLCESDDEKRCYARMLESTIVAIARRLRAFDRAAHERLVNQGVFDFVRPARRQG